MSLLGCRGRPLIRPIAIFMADPEGYQKILMQRMQCKNIADRAKTQCKSPYDRAEQRFSRFFSLSEGAQRQSTRAIVWGPTPGLYICRRRHQADRRVGSHRGSPCPSCQTSQRLADTHVLLHAASFQLELRRFALLPRLPLPRAPGFLGAAASLSDPKVQRHTRSRSR